LALGLAGWLALGAWPAALAGWPRSLLVVAHFSLVLSSIAEPANLLGGGSNFNHQL